MLQTSSKSTSKDKVVAPEDAADDINEQEIADAMTEEAKTENAEHDSFAAIAAQNSPNLNLNIVKEEKKGGEQLDCPKFSDMLQDEAFLAGLPKRTTLIDVIYAIAGCELPSVGHGGLNSTDVTIEATQASNSLLNTTSGTGAQQ